MIDGWTIYDPLVEFERMGVSAVMIGTSSLRITKLNTGFVIFVPIFFFRDLSNIINLVMKKVPLIRLIYVFLALFQMKLWNQFLNLGVRFTHLTTMLMYMITID